MQLMSWMIARLGSRFSLVFEPYRQRVMHSALGRFMDEPMDLMVGLQEPDGERRVLPFTADGKPLCNCEQFERLNSITFRGFSDAYGLRFEFNVHSVFYPQTERLCIMPAFYLEMRVNPVHSQRWFPVNVNTPKTVKLFIRVARSNTNIAAKIDEAGQPRIDLSYRNRLTPRTDRGQDIDTEMAGRDVAVAERIVSLNPNCRMLEEGQGLELDLPVTEVGSGIKWRLVWAAYVDQPVLYPRIDEQERAATFRYCQAWSDLDHVVTEAIETRDDRLAHSRRLEKVVEQAPLDGAQRHLLNQTFQSYLGNTFWCDVAETDRKHRPWFSVWEGSNVFHSTLDVEYNNALFYLTLWPGLLAMQFDQWAEFEQLHSESMGGTLSHDMGLALRTRGTGYDHEMEVEENANFLLLLQAYTRWTADKTVARRHEELIIRLAEYLKWSDTDDDGFPTEGIYNTVADGGPAIQLARKQTYLGVKRLAALRAAADLLSILERNDVVGRYLQIIERDLQRIEEEAWLGDHYAVCCDRSAVGIVDPNTGRPLPTDHIEGWDAYSIYTGNALLLPELVGQPPMLDVDRLRQDIAGAFRENQSRYGSGHTSDETENVRVSQNIWRDVLARYVKVRCKISAQNYWDLQVMGNTHHQSMGFFDAYRSVTLTFYPRGVTAMGYLLGGPRLIIDRLAPGGIYATVDPDRHYPQRWPLLPLADWKAGKVPVLVVEEQGKATLEGNIDPIIIHGNAPAEQPAKDMIG